MKMSLCIWYIHIMSQNHHTQSLKVYTALNYSSAINKDNFYGTQFHPEKSGLIGEKIIKNFISEL